VEHLSLDHEMRVTAVSSSFLAAIDCSREEVLGHHIRDLIVLGAGAKANRFQVLGAIAGSVAHDFNNLLTVIQGNIDAACEQLPADSAARGDLLLAQEAGKRAVELIAQVLDVGSGEDAGVELDLNAVIAEAVPLLRRVIGEDIELKVDAEPVWPVRARRTQIEQILLNLAVNARDAMPDGGTLALCLRNERVAGPCPGVRPVLPTGDYAVIAFGDSGCGMDASTQERLFEPFFTTKKKGTGLGLATVARIVGRVRGGIRVDSQQGSGSKFEIYLPRA
jgi:signal transduction histidine kinase